jgi:hypothetical protein
VQEDVNGCAKSNNALLCFKSNEIDSIASISLRYLKIASLMQLLIDVDVNMTKILEISGMMSHIIYVDSVII